MDRLIEIIRISNIDQFDFDLREFAESPQVARYDASDNGHFAWHSDVGEGILARKRKLTLVLQLSEPDSMREVTSRLCQAPKYYLPTAAKAV